MIQAARSANSRSFLREAKSAILVLADDEAVSYFNRRIDEVIKNREANAPFSGAKAVREELLAYLNRFGEVQTANIWARGLVVEVDAIEHLRCLVATELAKNDIYGVVEIHLQDREINSAHLQFVGVKAQMAERIIAQIVVDLKYELSLKSAMSKEAVPYYEIDSSVRTMSLEEQLSFDKKDKEVRAISDGEISFYSRMQKKRDEFYNILNSSLNEAKSAISVATLKGIKADYDYYNKSTNELLDSINDRIKKLRR